MADVVFGWQAGVSKLSSLGQAKTDFEMLWKEFNCWSKNLEGGVKYQHLLKAMADVTLLPVFFF